jgi:glutathione peroxidase-family protein
MTCCTMYSKAYMERNYDMLQELYDRYKDVGFAVLVRFV